MWNRSAKYLAAVLLAVFTSNTLDSYISFATSFEPVSQSSQEQEDPECENFETAAVLPGIFTISKKFVKPVRGFFTETHIWIPERYELPELEPPAGTI